MNPKFDLLSIGDSSMDVFITPTESEALCILDDKECLICFSYGDKIPVKNIDFSVGGNAANLAVGAVRLGLKTGLALTLGDDFIGREIVEKLKKEVQELKTAKRQEIALRLQDAKALGDLSENAEYLEAKEAQAFNESKIIELEEVIRNTVLIEKNHKKNIVQIGSTIEVKSKNGQERFVIVGSEEADPLEGKISNESPLGKSFLDHKAGDQIEVQTPGGAVKYEIVKIG